MVEHTRAGLSLSELAEIDNDWVEIINGEIVEHHMQAAGLQHNQVVVNVTTLLSAFVRDHKLGTIHTDGLTYVLATEGETVMQTRLPDVSFLRKGRITRDMDLSKPFIGAPNLAIEVTSPGQTADSLRGRILDYLAAGTEQVWVLYVASSEVYIYDSATPKKPTIYSSGERFQVTMFSGLMVHVDALFDLDELFDDEDE